MNIKGFKTARAGAPWAGAALAAAIVVAGFGQAQAQNPLFLNVGSSSSASSQYTYWVSAGQSIEAGTNGRIVVNVMETGASVDNIRRMKRGEMEMGLSTGEAAGQAYYGVGAFKDDAPMKNLRTLWFYAALPAIYVVRADANVSAPSDLQGKAYNAGIPGSSTEAQTRAVFSTLGISADLTARATADAIDALRDGRIVGFTKAAASATVVDASFMELNTTVDVRILGFGKDQIAKVIEEHPYYSATTVPAGVYPGQDQPIQTLAAAAGGVATVESLSEQDAYEIVKAIFEQKQIQVDAYPAAGRVDYGPLSIELATIPFHAGAIRYFREIGIDVPDRLVPPEAK
ncbi:MAG: TAXI family TRAP transporter solute-binding subunit [Alphaproteobacteria bacterium]|nr:TAXI family TRAP transporter solute-binding subunit [Alphaproteobacteria bacterium]